MGSHGYNDLTVGRPITLCQNENGLKRGEGRKEGRQQLRIKAVYRGADEWHRLSPREATNNNDIRWKLRGSGQVTGTIGAGPFSC